MCRKHYGRNARKALRTECAENVTDGMRRKRYVKRATSAPAEKVQSNKQQMLPRKRLSQTCNKCARGKGGIQQQSIPTAETPWSVWRLRYTYHNAYSDRKLLVYNHAKPHPGCSGAARGQPDRGRPMATTRPQSVWPRAGHGPATGRPETLRGYAHRATPSRNSGNVLLFDDLGALWRKRLGND